jgi:hypothetical protein
MSADGFVSRPSFLTSCRYAELTAASASLSDEYATAKRMRAAPSGRLSLSDCAAEKPPPEKRELSLGVREPPADDPSELAVSSGKRGPGSPRLLSHASLSTGEETGFAFERVSTMSWMVA